MRVIEVFIISRAVSQRIQRLLNVGHQEESQLSQRAQDQSKLIQGRGWRRDLIA